MDVLVSLGTNASYIFSVISLLFERAHQVRKSPLPPCRTIAPGLQAHPRHDN